MNTLEILIPTYGRPESAAKSIESCLASPDPRLSVRCNSNGYEESLERFREIDKRLIYNCFDRNYGVHANFLYLLKNTKARFCMLLSDEDCIDPNAINNLLDFLDNCHESINVISCSLYDTSSKSYYYKPSEKVSEMSFGLNEVAAISPIPSYMSGLIFSTKNFEESTLNDVFKDSIGNSYPHLDLVNILLTNGLLRFYSLRLVLQGAPVKKGGDSYSHRKTNQSKDFHNLDLNPLVYGIRARARQFYYLEYKLYKLRLNMKITAYLLAKLNLLMWIARAILNANFIVITDRNQSISAEIKLAFDEAIQCKEYSESFFSSLFYPVSLGFKPIKKIFGMRFAKLLIFGILGNVIDLARKIAKFIIINNNKNISRTYTQ